MGKWIINSAWPYVNSVPHLGTFIHLLSADVYTRYLRLKGEEVIAVTGSDEHGTPIEVEAVRKGVPPKQLTDEIHKQICNLLDVYNIRFDNYTRTENPVHIRYTQDLYRKVYANGYVYTENVNLPYCEKDQRFLPDRFVEGTCPHCGYEQARGDQCESCGRVLDPLELISPRCAFCSSTPTVKSSTHWFFDLPKFRDKLLTLVQENKQLPENARNFSLKWLEEGLKPRALTRDNKWGIPAPFPGAEGKTIYVWLEAVLGYVSASIEWAEKSGKPDAWKEFWFDKQTKNVHFIGKDNIPFHVIIFPSLLLATHDDYVLPWQVSSTEFILFEGQKFSKSKKVGVWIDEALKVAPAEYWRYILIAIRPEARDANFTWRDFEAHINSELNDVLGNFVHRTLTFVNNQFDSKIPEPHELDEKDEALKSRIESSPLKVGALFDQFQLRSALGEIIELARAGNQYLSEREPWHLIKKDKDKASTTLYFATQLVRSLSILISPVLPETAQHIRDQLNLAQEVKWSDAGKLELEVGHTIGKATPLFHKISAPAQ
ncbi:MAG: methionine--tRNA ligase [Candidatus Bathyarchaeia archaeon]|jgi:methionyl-tRNA synthetase